MRQAQHFSTLPSWISGNFTLYIKVISLLIELWDNMVMKLLVGQAALALMLSAVLVGGKRGKMAETEQSLQEVLFLDMGNEALAQVGVA